MSTTQHTGLIGLSAMMGTYKKTAPLKEGKVTSPLLRLDFGPIEVAQKGFKDVVRGLKYDVAELAIITFLQAFDAKKPYVLLPFVMNGMFHHKSLLCRTDSPLTPGDLAGKRVAMRAYTQTTPTWVRGILSDEYGVKPGDVKWLSQEGAHVAEYQDPAFVSRLDEGVGLEDLLVAGEVDAIIAGGAISGDKPVRSMIPQAKEAALDWHRRTGVVPINHMVAIRSEIAEQRPDLVRDVFRMLKEGRSVSGDLVAIGELDLQPVGFQQVGAALEMAVRYAYDQSLISRPFTLDELYGGVQTALA